jgi:hypothetical protein
MQSTGRTRERGRDRKEGERPNYSPFIWSMTQKESAPGSTTLIISPHLFPWFWEAGPCPSFFSGKKLENPRNGMTWLKLGGSNKGVARMKEDLTVPGVHQVT